MASKNVVQIIGGNFDAEVRKSTLPVLVDFWAEWCSPCRVVGTMLEDLADSYAGKLKVVKVNVDENHELAAEFNVRALPTLLVFKDGDLKEQVLGAPSRKDLESRLSAYL